MDKSEVARRVRENVYTYIVKYQKNGNIRIMPICTDDNVFPSDFIEEELELGEGDYKVIFEIRNEFGLDDFLSDEIINWLDGLGTFTNESSLSNDEVARYVAGYIDYLYNYCGWYDERGRQILKYETLSSILKYMDLRKGHPMAKRVIVGILEFFAISCDEKLNLRNQIEQVLSQNDKGDILIQLAKTDFIKIVRQHLDKIGNAYMITEEKSQYRIGVLFLKMYYAFSKSGFLLPKHIKEDGSVRNYTRFMQLMANYYGINNPPTYREGVLKGYREKGMKHTLYATIKKEHYDVWISLP